MHEDAIFFHLNVWQMRRRKPPHFSFACLDFFSREEGEAMKASHKTLFSPLAEWGWGGGQSAVVGGKSVYIRTYVGKGAM